MTTKLFLVQYVIEADVTEWPEFDEEKATRQMAKYIAMVLRNEMKEMAC